jgi:hypothetical protein
MDLHGALPNITGKGFDHSITNCREHLINVANMPMAKSSSFISCLLLTFLYIPNSILHIPSWLNLITHTLLCPVTHKLTIDYIQLEGSSSFNSTPQLFTTTCMPLPNYFVQNGFPMEGALVGARLHNPNKRQIHCALLDEPIGLNFHG